MRTRTVAVPLSVLAAAAGLAGGAYAASQADSHPHKALGCVSERPFISDAARRLHLTPARLTDALKAALVDQIDAAGRLPRAQANAIKRQIEHSPGLPFGPGLLGPGVIGAQVKAPPGFPHPQAIRAPGPFGPLAIVPSAARYLGLTETQLMQRLRRGESLAQIAKARGKSESALEHAITAKVKSEPGPAVALGHIRIQGRVSGPPACFAAVPPPVLRTSIGPPRR